MENERKRKTSSSKKSRETNWAMEPFRECLKQLDSLSVLMRLSVQGINMVSASHKAAEVLYKHKAIMSEISDDAKNLSDEEHLERLNRSKEMSDLAKSEIEKDFPLLHSQGIVTVWAFLEGAVRSFVCAWIKNNKNIYDINEFKKIKINVSEYEKLNVDEKAYYIFDVYERDVVQGFPYGVKRFEKLLAPIGFSGPLNRSIVRNLYEMAQIRNCIVHRAGFVDYTLKQKCPYLSMEVGDVIKISSNQYFEYMESVDDYLALLICRVAKWEGVDMDDTEKRILEIPVSLLKNK